MLHTIISPLPYSHLLALACLSLTFTVSPRLTRHSRQGMAVDVDTFTKFVSFCLAAHARTDDRHNVSGGSERARFRPHPAIERNRQILNDDESPQGGRRAAANLHRRSHQHSP